MRKYWISNGFMLQYERSSQEKSGRLKQEKAISDRSIEDQEKEEGGAYELCR